MLPVALSELGLLCSMEGLEGALVSCRAVQALVGVLRGHGGSPDLVQRAQHPLSQLLLDAAAREVLNDVGGIGAVLRSLELCARHAGAAASCVRTILRAVAGNDTLSRTVGERGMHIVMAALNSHSTEAFTMQGLRVCCGSVVVVLACCRVVWTLKWVVCVPFVCVCCSC